jgi:hypothetical protein
MVQATSPGALLRGLHGELFDNGSLQQEELP